MADTPGSCRTNGQDGQRSHWVWIKVTLKIVWIASVQFSIVLTKQIPIAIDWLQGGLWVWLCGWNKKWGDCRVPGRGKSTTLRGGCFFIYSKTKLNERSERHINSDISCCAFLTPGFLYFLGAGWILPYCSWSSPQVLLWPLQVYIFICEIIY